MPATQGQYATHKGTLESLFPDKDAQPFKVITVDFITKLPMSQHYNSILTVTVHNCTKAALLIPCKEEITAEGVANLFMSYVF